MFVLIGLGLGDAEDITVKGLAAVRRASKVYLEAYTSVLTVGVDKLVCSSSVGVRRITQWTSSDSSPHLTLT